MKNIVLVAHSTLVFACYKLIAGDAFGLGFGFGGNLIAFLIGIVCWLVVARLGNWRAFILHGFLFSTADALWRGWNFLQQSTNSFIELLNGAPVTYFVVIYSLQALIVASVLVLLRQLPKRVDNILWLPAWIVVRLS